jgi:hypothetical protein
MAVVSQQMKKLGRVVGVCGALAFLPPAVAAEFDDVTDYLNRNFYQLTD